MNRIIPEKVQQSERATGNKMQTVNSIGPIKDWKSRLLFIIPGNSWGDVIERLRADVTAGIGSQTLVEFAEAIARWPVADGLYPSNCMFNLVVSDTPDFKSINGTLHIAYRADIERFIIHHICSDGHQEFMTCVAVEATATFERLVRRSFQSGRGSQQS